MTSNAEWEELFRDLDTLSRRLASAARAAGIPGERAVRREYRIVETRKWLRTVHTTQSHDVEYDSGDYLVGILTDRVKGGQFILMKAHADRSPQFLRRHQVFEKDSTVTQVTPISLRAIPSRMMDGRPLTPAEIRAGVEAGVVGFLRRHNVRL